MRCIAHMDLDCFYAQVEALRLGIDCGVVPFGLSQWGNLLAVSYPARTFGVKRMESLDSALQKCPAMQHSHVATYRVGEAEYKYHPRPDKGNYKVSLEPYRIASKAIFQHLTEIPHITVEKGGIDEVFVDLTEAAAEWIARSAPPGFGAMSEEELLLFAERSSRVVPRKADSDVLRRRAIGEVPELAPPDSLDELRLLVAGCEVTSAIRASVRTMLGYYFSAGVSHNKMLAKVLSARNKPNQQTLLPPARTFDFLVDFPFQALRGLGGKFGERVSGACDGAQFCGELWGFTVADLEVKVFQATRGARRDEAVALYRQVRGEAGSTLTERILSKSIMANKAFAPSTTDKEVLKQWLTVLAAEVVGRVTEFCEANGVRAKTLRIWFGNNGLYGTGDVLNKSGPIPEPLTTRSIVDQGLSWFAAFASPSTSATSLPALAAARLASRESVEASSAAAAAPPPEEVPQVNFIGVGVSGFSKITEAERCAPRRHQLSIVDMLSTAAARRTGSVAGAHKPQADRGRTAGPSVASSAPASLSRSESSKSLSLDCESTPLHSAAPARCSARVEARRPRPAAAEVVAIDVDVDDDDEDDDVIVVA